MKQFTIRGAMMLVTATATGFWLARVSELGLGGFFLGALTALIAGGLMGQIIAPPSIEPDGLLLPYARQCVLCMILISLGVAIYQTLNPFVPSTAEAKIYEIEPDRPIESTLGLPFWWFCLFLGSLTSPGVLPTSRKHRSSRRQTLGRMISIAVVVGMFIYVISLAKSWALMTVLVDIAIAGIKNAMFQGPSVGTDAYVEWFGRNPSEFQEFCRLQITTWILLLASFFTATGFANQSSKTFRFADILRLMLVVALALPAVWNLAWLSNGNALRLFPEFTSTFWMEPRPDLWLAPFVVILISLFFSTRRVAEENRSQYTPHLRRYWSDSGLVAPLFMTPLFFQSAELMETIQWMLMWYEDAVGLWAATKLYFYVCAELILGSPEYCWPIFLWFYAIFLGWCWWRRPADASIRWPQIGVRQATWMPIIFVLLVLLIALALPFGLALQRTFI